MKVAPVDRYGGWRAVGASTEARSSAASRLQTLTSETTAEPIKTEMTSGRELPVVPVKQGSRVQARVVQEGERPRTVEVALSTYNSMQAAAEAKNPTRPTSDAVPSAGNAKGVASGSETPNASQAARTSEAKAPTSDPRFARSGVASLTEEGKNAVFGDPKLQEAREAQQNKERAAEEARRPAAEPISKMLIDHVHNMWAASRSVVDLSNSAANKVTAADPVGQVGGASGSAVTAKGVSRRAKS